jgi:hypothetical protein
MLAPLFQHLESGESLKISVMIVHIKNTELEATRVLTLSVVEGFKYLLSKIIGLIPFPGLHWHKIVQEIGKKHSNTEQDSNM